MLCMEKIYCGKVNYENQLKNNTRNINDPPGNKTFVKNVHVNCQINAVK